MRQALGRHGTALSVAAALMVAAGLALWFIPEAVANSTANACHVGAFGASPLRCKLSTTYE